MSLSFSWHHYPLVWNWDRMPLTATSCLITKTSGEGERRAVLWQVLYFKSGQRMVFGHGRWIVLDCIESLYLKVSWMAWKKLLYILLSCDVLWWNTKRKTVNRILKSIQQNPSNSIKTKHKNIWSSHIEIKYMRYNENRRTCWLNLIEKSLFLSPH